MVWYLFSLKLIILVPVVTIVSNPVGTPVSGSTNTFDYPILSSVTLTCMVTSSDGGSTMFTVTNYQWDTTGCFTNNAHNTPTCFPTNQTTQSVTGNNLLAKDAGTITCSATIGGVNYTSGPLILHISGIHIIQTFKHTCTHLFTLYSKHVISGCIFLKNEVGIQATK